VSRNKRRLIRLLADEGLAVNETGIIHAKGWTTSVHKKWDDTTVTWECYAYADGSPLSHHVVSYDTILECVRNGIVVDKDDRDLTWVYSKPRA
jgi:hypothetical protein